MSDHLKKAEQHVKAAKDILLSKGVPAASSSAEFTVKAIEELISALKDRVLPSEVEDPTQS